MRYNLVMLLVRLIDAIARKGLTAVGESFSESCNHLGPCWIHTAWGHDLMDGNVQVVWGNKELFRYVFSGDWEDYKFLPYREA